MPATNGKLARRAVMRAGGAAPDELAERGGGHLDAALASGRRRLGEIPIDGRLPGAPNDRGFHRGFPFAFR